jgi:hypothetical protein
MGYGSFLMVRVLFLASDPVAASGEQEVSGPSPVFLRRGGLACLLGRKRVNVPNVFHENMAARRVVY